MNPNPGPTHGNAFARSANQLNKYPIDPMKARAILGMPRFCRFENHLARKK